MQGFLLRTAITLGIFSLGLGIVFADDVPASPSLKPMETPKTTPLAKAAECTGYVWVTMLTGEVVKADDSKVTVRIYWQAAVAGKSRGGRSSLHSGRGTHSPFATRRPNVQIKWEHHDYEIPYHTDGMARTKQLPPRIGPDGKRGYYSGKEQDALCAPLGAPGFQALKSDITPGTVIEAHLIRDKTIATNKVTDADMRIKYAVIHHHDPNSPKDIVAPSPAKKN